MRKPTNHLRELAADLWVVERPQSFYGLEVGTRMTVIRLAERRSASPLRRFALDAELRRELDAIGRVRFAVAPNRVHHLYAGDVAKSYPGRGSGSAPGLERKRPDLASSRCSATRRRRSGGDRSIRSSSAGAPTRTRSSSSTARAARSSSATSPSTSGRDRGPDAAPDELLRSYGRFGPSKLDPLLIRDRAAARQSLERILAWDFDRVIVAHGDVLESGGHALLRDGYAWLLAK